MSSSISAGVRCSRLRRSALRTRRGGTFPFSRVGAVAVTSAKCAFFALVEFLTFPISRTLGTVGRSLLRPLLRLLRSWGWPVDLAHLDPQAGRQAREAGQA